MVYDPKDVKAGDPISARLWNDAKDAIRAGWDVRGGAGVFARNNGNGLELAISQADEMDFQITSGPNSDGGYEWKEVQQASPNTWQATGVTGGASNNDLAYPRQWSSATNTPQLPANSTVYHARRAQGSSQWVFDAPGSGLVPAKCTSGIASGSLSSPGSATVTLLVASGTGFTTTGGTTVTAYNTFGLAVGTNKFAWLTFVNGHYYVVSWDC